MGNPISFSSSAPLALSALLALSACQKSRTETGSAAPPGSASVTSAEHAAPTTPTSPMAKPTSEAPTLKPVMTYTGLATPESVIYDSDADRYLLSNINGKATDADNNGYISVLAPDGKISTEKWIEGGKNKVTLNAPKGLALSAGVLYVADLDTVRMFDAATGAPKSSVKIPGATFLNDMAVGPDGKVYVSDSGLKAGEGGSFVPTSTDAVYVLEGGKARPIAKDPSLGRPNGLHADTDGVWVVTFGSNELYRLDAAGKKHDDVKLPRGSLDGLAKVGNDFYISSWDASAIYRGPKTGPFTAVITDVKSPADIGYDTKRSRLLVPHFTEDKVDVFELR